MLMLKESWAFLGKIKPNSLLNPPLRTKETYTSIIGGYCRDGDVNTALQLFHRMNVHSCAPGSFTYGAPISGLFKDPKLDVACQLHETMMDKGLSPSKVTWLTLAHEYCKKGNSATAMILVQKKKSSGSKQLIHLDEEAL
ncbi:hypothetical protein SLEP1_g44967 [Rubroshorea leprosula]|uniref:Pentatricopeptide repeat-containing protein n=1 Tax=Rubroshorea leprosula TaxID=152421 RepID=A0AAV5LI81_9ROSI|nr:hypothetical protein SLEP1_g44967 [Rubroshorea leprosula]